MKATFTRKNLLEQDYSYTPENYLKAYNIFKHTEKAKTDELAWAIVFAVNHSGDLSPFNLPEQAIEDLAERMSYEFSPMNMDPKGANERMAFTDPNYYIMSIPEWAIPVLAYNEDDAYLSDEDRVCINDFHKQFKFIQVCPLNDSSEQEPYFCKPDSIFGQACRCLRCIVEDKQKL